MGGSLQQILPVSDRERAKRHSRYIKGRLMMLGRISQVDVETSWLPISKPSPPLPCMPVSVSRDRISQSISTVVLSSTYLQSCRAAPLKNWAPALLTAASRALPGPGVKLSSGLRRHQRTPGLSCADNPGCCSYPAAALPPPLQDTSFLPAASDLLSFGDLLAACSFWQACPFVANQTALQFHQSSDTIHSRLQFLRATRRSYHHVRS